MPNVFIASLRLSDVSKIRFTTLKLLSVGLSTLSTLEEGSRQFHNPPGTWINLKAYKHSYIRIAEDTFVFIGCASHHLGFVVIHGLSPETSSSYQDFINYKYICSAWWVNFTFYLVN